MLVFLFTVCVVMGRLITSTLLCDLSKGLLRFPHVEITHITNGKLLKIPLSLDSMGCIRNNIIVMLGRQSSDVNRRAEAKCCQHNT